MFVRFVASSEMAKLRQGWPLWLRLSTSLQGSGMLLLLLLRQHPIVLPAQMARSLPDRGTKFQKPFRWCCRAVICRRSSQRANMLSSTTSAGTAAQGSSTAPATRRASGAQSGANGIMSITVAMAFERPTVSSRCIASQTSHILPRACSVFEQEENWTSPIYRYGLFSALTRARNVSMCIVLNLSLIHI